jgi:hypothetical protein
MVLKKRTRIFTGLRTRLVAGLVTGLALAPAVFAEGTPSNSLVTNNVTLSYQVNSATQTGSAAVSFRVDRKLNLDVVTQNADWVNVVPGQTATPGTAGALDYLVTNRSNDTVPVRVALIDRNAAAVTGFAAQVPSPATFAPSPATGTMWNDLNDNDAIDGGEQSAALSASGVTILNLGAMAADADTNIKVVLDVDSGALGSRYRAFTLVATSLNGGGSPFAGDQSGNAAPGGSASDVPNDINAVEVVFADGGSTNAEDIRYDFINSAALTSLDASSDGQAVDTSGFITLVTLAVAKHVEVLYDPISGNRYNGSGAATAENPKAIPGAVLLYVIGVRNNTSSVTAASVEIDDNIPDAANEVLVGDQANPTTPIDIPTSVTITVSGSPVTFTLDRTNISTNLDQVWVRGCAATNATGQAFGAGDPEIDNAVIGTCNAGQTGYIAYLVTVNDT